VQLYIDIRFVIKIQGKIRVSETKKFILYLSQEAYPLYINTVKKMPLNQVTGEISS
jgi:hypothetical protein